MSDAVNVLMVDDELVVLEAFVDILEDEGYTMFTADNGEKAVEILRANPIDIVVSDIKMPGMDGLELLSVVREIDADIPVIMATAYSSIESTVESMKRGASNYLIKPVKIELLKSVLAEAAAKRRTLRENRHFAEELKQLNAERERVLEILGQDLRQPLIDQMNWCELLLSDSEHSLYREHIEHIAKINSVASQMLGHVNELLDEEQIKQRARDAKTLAENVRDGECGPSETETPDADRVSAGDADADHANQTSEHVKTQIADGHRLVACDGIPSVPDKQSEFKILVVEPCSALRDLLVSALERPFHVFSAADGWEGVKLMVERPQLVITEVDLPFVDAADMLQHARNIVPDFAVLAMYNKNDKALLPAISRLGVQETLLKPFHLADVVAKAEVLSGADKAYRNHSILVYCQDPLDGYALYQVLNGRYRTCLATSIEAARVGASEPFDVLMVDTTGGDDSWQDVVRSLRGKNDNLKVLALYEAKDESVVRDPNGGIDSAILKPYAINELLLQVRGLLGIKEINGHIMRNVYRKLAI